VAISALSRSSVGTFDKFVRTSGASSTTPLLIVVNGSNGASQGVSTSSDGITWTFTANTNYPWTKFVYIKRTQTWWGMNNNQLTRSFNGTTWVRCGAPFSSNNSGAFDLKLSADKNDFTYTFQSMDGLGGGMERLGGQAGTLGFQAQSQAISSTFNIAGTSGGVIRTRNTATENIDTWTNRGTPNSGQILDMECNGNTVLFTTNTTASFRSLDGGATWASAGTIGSSNYNRCIRFINNIWFVFTDPVYATQNGFYSSTNLSSWTLTTVESQTDIRDITFANGLYIIVTGSGRIYTSPNLTTWTRQTSNLTSAAQIATNF
jgi:hypothetical protein